MYKNEKVGAVIVAAGESRRMDGLDKIWATLSGKPLLFWVLTAFQNNPVIDEIVIVINKSSIDVCWKKINDEQAAGPFKFVPVAPGARILSPPV